MAVRASAGVSFLAPRGKFDIEFRESSLSFVDKNGALAAICPVSNIAVSNAISTAYISHTESNELFDGVVPSRVSIGLEWSELSRVSNRHILAGHF